MGPVESLSSLLSSCLWRWWVKSLSDLSSAAFTYELLDLERVFFWNGTDLKTGQVQGRTESNLETGLGSG